jgi:hypothetical protein
MERVEGQDRWNDSLRAAVVAAKREAATLLPQPEAQIGTHHLLIGILSGGESRAGRFLIAEGATDQTLRQAISFMLRSPGTTLPMGTDNPDVIIEPVEVTIEPVVNADDSRTIAAPIIPPYTPAAEIAFAKTVSMTDGLIDVEHLLLAILDTESVGTGILEACTGKRLPELRRRARRYLG